MTSLTALILTFNEERNIGRTLGALSWAKEILIIDSGSTDGTIEIARSAHPGVNILQRSFDTHATQWNFGLQQVATPWVLALDADYELSPELVAEIQTLSPGEEISGYEAQFEYRIFGRPLRASVYPPRVVLFRRDRGAYYDDGHTQRLRIEGKVVQLAGKIYHDDRKSLSHWLQAQDKYATIEAEHLLREAAVAAGKGEGVRGKSEEGGEANSEPRRYSGSSIGRRSTPNAQRRMAEGERESGKGGSDHGPRTTDHGLSWQDRLRLKIFFAAPAMFLYLLFGRGLILDGWPGWIYVAQRTIAELLLSMRLLIEREKLKNLKH
jgi:Glycosyl transferase family 2